MQQRRVYYFCHNRITLTLQTRLYKLRASKLAFFKARQLALINTDYIYVLLIHYDMVLYEMLKESVYHWSVRVHRHHTARSLRHPPDVKHLMSRVTRLLY